MEYSYPHFTRTALLQDTWFKGGPRPGEVMPEFDLLTTDGRRFRKSDMVGKMPLLLIFGSFT